MPHKQILNYDIVGTGGSEFFKHELLAMNWCGY